MTYWKHSRAQHLDIISKYWPTCPDCQLHFPSKKTLARHFKNKHHTVVRKTDCDYCQLSFKMPHLYTTHANKCHKDVIKDNWHKCPTCGYHLQTEASLVHHKGLHGGVSPKVVNCDFCPLQFRFLKTFHNHANAAHAEAVIAAWKFCDKCLKFYPENQHNHFNILIEEISCKFCSEVFENKSEHVFHCNVEHLDLVSAAWFVCAICDEYHPTKRSLTSHESQCQNLKKNKSRSRKRKQDRSEEASIRNESRPPIIISLTKKSILKAKEDLDKIEHKKPSKRMLNKKSDADDPDEIPVKRSQRKRKAVVQEDFVKLEDDHMDFDVDNLGADDVDLSGNDQVKLNLGVTLLKFFDAWDK
jgi:hypothetical protein